MAKDYYIELRNLLLNEGKEFNQNDINNLPKFKGVYVMFEKDQKDKDGKARIIRVGKAERSFQTRLKEHFSGSIKNSVFRRHILSAILKGKHIAKDYSAKSQEALINKFLQNITFKLIRVPKLFTCEELEKMCIRTVAKHSENNIPKSSLNIWEGRNCANDNVKKYHIWNSDDVNYINELDAYYFDLIECGLVRK